MKKSQREIVSYPNAAVINYGNDEDVANHTPGFLNTLTQSSKLSRKSN